MRQFAGVKLSSSDNLIMTSHSDRWMEFTEQSINMLPTYNALLFIGQSEKN